MYNAKGKIQQKVLIEEHLQLVRKEALHLSMQLPSNIDLDDLIQAGNMGLMDAVTRYQSDKGVHFEYFARQRIRGSMIDEVRRSDWVPRLVRKNIKEMDLAIKTLTNSLGRHPEEGEIAKEMGISMDTYLKILMNTNGTVSMSIDEVGMDFVDEHINDHEKSPLEQMLESHERGELALAINALPEKEKLMLSLYYNEQMNMKEIGATLGVSESRVCQIHSQAVARLRASLA